ncbi:unnamed protein product, partial [Meganyctiphanes norvegica]
MADTSHKQDLAFTNTSLFLGYCGFWGTYTCNPPEKFILTTKVIWSVPLWSRIVNFIFETCKLNTFYNDLAQKLGLSISVKNILIDAKIIFTTHPLLALCQLKISEFLPVNCSAVIYGFSNLAHSSLSLENSDRNVEAVAMLPNKRAIYRDRHYKTLDYAHTCQHESRQSVTKAERMLYKRFISHKSLASCASMRRLSIASMVTPRLLHSNLTQDEYLFNKLHDDEKKKGRRLAKISCPSSVVYSQLISYYELLCVFDLAILSEKFVLVKDETQIANDDYRVTILNIIGQVTAGPIISQWWTTVTGNCLACSGYDFVGHLSKRNSHFLDCSMQSLASNEMLQRVNRWRSSIKPKLETEEKRNYFDIHSYGGDVIENFSKIGETLTFEEITRKYPQKDVSRVFLACLMLGNSYNLKLCSPGGDRSMDDLKLMLLSRVRQHQNMEEYVAPSQQQPSPKRKRMESIVVQNPNKKKKSVTFDSGIFLSTFAGSTFTGSSFNFSNF